MGERTTMNTKFKISFHASFLKNIVGLQPWLKNENEFIFVDTLLLIGLNDSYSHLWKAPLGNIPTASLLIGK